MKEDFLIAGFGGQGVMFAGQLLAYAANEAGLQATWIPSYGPEMRGGTAHCSVVVSDRAIGSPIARHPSVVIAFNGPSFDKYEPILAPGGLLVSNVSLIPARSQRLDIRRLDIPATEMASAIGDTHVTNLVLLGAALTACPVISLEVLRRTLEAHIPERRRSLLPANLEAIQQGEAFARSHVMV